MEDRKPPFGFSLATFSAFSGRRKAAVMVAIVLLGAILADPTFLIDAPGTVGVSTNSGNLNEIELMLSEFSKEGSAKLSESAPVESSAAAAESTTLIIPPPDSSVDIPVQNVSFPTDQGTSLADFGTGTMPPPSTHETSRRERISSNRRGRHNSSAPPLAIRLTGTIYPAQ